MTVRVFIELNMEGAAFDNAPDKAVAQALAYLSAHIVSERYSFRLKDFSTDIQDEGGRDVARFGYEQVAR